MSSLQTSTSRQKENGAVDDFSTRRLTRINTERNLDRKLNLNFFSEKSVFIRANPRLIFFFLASLLVMVALSPAAVAQIDTCPTGTLDSGPPLGQQGPDLVIEPGTTCTVDGSSKTYNFHNVYIFGDATQNKTTTLMFSDATMDFYAANILVQNQGVLQATGIGVNNGGQILTIHLYGSATDPGITCKKLDSNKNVVDDVTCGVPDGGNGSPTSGVPT